MATQITSYKQLEVWRTAMDLAKEVYAETAGLPPSERYGLTSQLRRAAVSIPANIAEGNGRAHRKEYAQSLNVAMGSLCEVETLLLLCEELDLLRPRPVVQQSLESTGRMLNRLRSAILGS